MEDPKKNETAPAEPPKYEWQGPLLAPPEYYLGSPVRTSYKKKGRAVLRGDVEKRPNGTVAAKHNKAARRMLRAKLGRVQSSIDQKLREARKKTNVVRSYADNAHEAARLGVKLREEEKQIAATEKKRVYDERLWWWKMSNVWVQIFGTKKQKAKATDALTRFARGQ